jgi:hypothetical protein
MKNFTMKAALALVTVATIFLSFPVTVALAAYPTVKISDSFYVEKDIRVPEKKDQRVDILKKYLETHKSPMVANAKDFVEAADKYDLDWKLVASIAGVESTFGKHTPGSEFFGNESYNAWGWGVYGDNSLGFPSWKDGIYTVSRGLREKYVNRGLRTPLEMNRIYASSKTWGVRVDYFMSRIAEFEAKYADPNAISLEEDHFDVQTAGESAKPFVSAPLTTVS